MEAEGQRGYPTPKIVVFGAYWKYLCLLATNVPIGCLAHSCSLLFGYLQSRRAKGQWEEGTNTLNGRIQINMESKSHSPKWYISWSSMRALHSAKEHEGWGFRGYEQVHSRELAMTMYPFWTMSKGDQILDVSQWTITQSTHSTTHMIIAPFLSSKEAVTSALDDPNHLSLWRRHKLTVSASSVSSWSWGSSQKLFRKSWIDIMISLLLLHHAPIFDYSNEEHRLWPQSTWIQIMGLPLAPEWPWTDTLTNLPNLLPAS